jgi:hypothetical protein
MLAGWSGRVFGNGLVTRLVGLVYFIPWAVSVLVIGNGRFGIDDRS